MMLMAMTFNNERIGLLKGIVYALCTENGIEKTQGIISCPSCGGFKVHKSLACPVLKEDITATRALPSNSTPV